MNSIRLLAWILSTVAAATVLADSVSITSAKDNTLYEDSAGQISNGRGVVMFTGETNGNGSRRGLLEFDVAGSVPAGSTVTGANLRLNCSRTTSGSKRIELHRALQEWGEGASDAGLQGGGGAQAEPGDATWLHTFYSTSFWTNPGGDFAPTSSADTNVSGAGTYNWNAAGMVADVQTWLDSSADNHGWVMVGVENGARSAKRFNTRENTSAGTRPLLTITYTVPEPATLALLAGGLTLLLRRK